MNNNVSTNLWNLLVIFLENLKWLQNDAFVRIMLLFESVLKTQNLSNSAFKTFNLNTKLNLLA